MARLPHVHHQHGFTIVEVMVAATILVIGVLGVVTMVDGANARTVQSQAREGGVNLARELTEQTRLVPYSRAGQDRILDQLQAADGLSDKDSDTAGWQVDRRKINYTVAVESCLMDDPNDGVGEHDDTYCAEAGDGGTDDDNPRDYRRVTFDIEWTAQGANREVRQATILTPRGTADLPRVTNFDLMSPSYSGTADAPIITTATSPVRFRATTSTPAAGISWLVDGGPRGVTSNVQPQSTWNWDWNIASLVDGTYKVSPQPFDASGAAGIAGEKTIKLNRFAPAAPTPVYSGWSIPPGGQVNGMRDVDIEWIASRERDVVGYRVYQQQRNSTTGAVSSITRMCPAAASTDSYTTKPTCPHTFPQAQVGFNQLNYWVVAIDKTGATDVLREGTASPQVDVYGAVYGNNKRPQAIQSVTLNPILNGGQYTIPVTWPIVNDPDTGTSTSTVCNSPPGTVDCVLMYRIYRDGVRIGSTPYETPRPAGTTRTFVDVNPVSASHCYTVEAIDTRMREGGSKTTCLGGD